MINLARVPELHKTRTETRDGKDEERACVLNMSQAVDRGEQHIRGGRDSRKPTIVSGLSPFPVEV